MKKVILLSVILNFVTFGIGILLNTSMNLTLLILITLVIPVVYNIVLSLRCTESTILKSTLLSFFTTVFYFIFSLYFISRPSFENFIDEHQKNTGTVNIEIDKGFADVDQLIFIFLLNFIFIYIINFLKNKGSKNVNNH